MSTRPTDKLYSIEEHPSFRGVINELKGETRDFISTRLMILRAEMKEKAGALKTGMPLLAAGAVLGLTSLVMFNVVLLALIAHAMGDGTMGWLWSALILGVLYGILGGALAFTGMREIQRKGLIPTTTLKILKQDQDWIQQEAKTQI
jgi:Putative Actinobacterial Holin-X, holin superfamily III